MKKLKCDALFVSDLHIGSNQSQSDHLVPFLKRVKPKRLYIVGDAIDMWAIKYNAGVTYSYIQDIIDRAIESARGDVFDLSVLGDKRLVKASHLEALQYIFSMAEDGVQVVFVPGNHDIYFRKYDGFRHGKFSIANEAIYETPAGKRFLVRHGDEFDTLLKAFSRLSDRTACVEEIYSGTGRFLNAAFEVFRRRPHVQSRWSPQATLESAATLLAAHMDFDVPKPTTRWHDHFSLAFTLEQAFKERTGHDRTLKTLLLRHLFRENGKAFACRAKGEDAPYLDGSISGHTHISEALAVESPRTPSGHHIGPCHVTLLNDGSWARGLPHIGRTALLFDGKGRPSMVRWDKKKGIVPHQPHIFPFNTYPTLPCSGCGTEAKIITARP